MFRADHKPATARLPTENQCVVIWEVFTVLNVVYTVSEKPAARQAVAHRQVVYESLRDYLKSKVLCIMIKAAL